MAVFKNGDRFDVSGRALRIKITNFRKEKI